jgi:probable addiction module antidote protein/putative addiction module killer protein
MIVVKKTDTFLLWLRGLRDVRAIARIQVRIDRLALGNPGNVKSVGDGISELRVDYWPGYRVYFAQHGKTLVVCCVAATSERKIRTLKTPGDWQRSGQMTLKTTPWDSAELLDSPESMAAYIEAAFEDGDPSLIAHALGVVARARGMSQLAKEAGLSRDAMYKAFQPDGNPTLQTLTSVMKALGMKLSAHTL